LGVLTVGLLTRGAICRWLGLSLVVSISWPKSAVYIIGSLKKETDAIAFPATG